jgi:hypothetical protein
MAISHQISSALLLGVCTGGELWLVDESGMIRIQMGKRNTSEMVAVHRMPCMIPPCNSNC